VFGGVYKLAAVKENGEYLPKIKVSESVEKLTTPHRKAVWRLYDNETGNAMADYITIFNEQVDTAGGITIFDPLETWKTKTITNCTAKNILMPVYEQGTLVYTTPSLEEIRTYCHRQIDTLWDEVKRFENPHRYYVDLSRTLWDERQKLLRALSM
jgi:nicotinate phosphoribosyltransferase